MSLSLVMLLFSSLLRVSHGSNLLCTNDSHPEWTTYDRGTWHYNNNVSNANNCSLTATSKTRGRSIVWLGDDSGHAGTEYVDVNFSVKTTVSIEESSDSPRTRDAGLIFRADSLDLYRSSQYYYFALFPRNGKVLFRKCCWSSLMSFGYENQFVYDQAYELRVDDVGSSYTFYVDGEKVWESVMETQWTNGTVGVMAFNAYATFSSFHYDKEIVPVEFDPQLYEVVFTIDTSYDGLADTDIEQKRQTQSTLVQDAIQYLWALADSESENASTWTFERVKFALITFSGEYIEGNSEPQIHFDLNNDFESEAEYLEAVAETFVDMVYQDGVPTVAALKTSRQLFTNSSFDCSDPNLHRLEILITYGQPNQPEIFGSPCLQISGESFHRFNEDFAGLNVEFYAFLVDFSSQQFECLEETPLTASVIEVDDSESLGDLSDVLGPVLEPTL